MLIRISWQPVSLPFFWCYHVHKSILYSPNTYWRSLLGCSDLRHQQNYLLAFPDQQSECCSNRKNASSQHDAWPRNWVSCHHKSLKSLVLSFLQIKCMLFKRIDKLIFKTFSWNSHSSAGSSLSVVSHTRSDASRVIRDTLEIILSFFLDFFCNKSCMILHPSHLTITFPLNSALHLFGHSLQLSTVASYRLRIISIWQKNKNNRDMGLKFLFRTFKKVCTPHMKHQHQYSHNFVNSFSLFCLQS